MGIASRLTGPEFIAPVSSKWRSAPSPRAFRLSVIVHTSSFSLPVHVKAKGFRADSGKAVVYSYLARAKTYP